jgi:hypothetical protein
VEIMTLITRNGFRRRATAIALPALLALLAACDATTSALATPTAIRTATPTALPTVLYQADWSRGADGWTLPPHWSIQGGALVNDGTGLDSIAVPYTVTVPDYEVDLVARALDVTSAPLNCAKLYGLRAADTSGNQLYYAQIYCIGTSPTHHPAASLLNVTASGDSQFATADFFPNTDVKTYRVQVHGKGIRFYPNSAAANGSIDTTVPLAPATFMLLDQYMPLVITRFSVLQLKV